MNKFFKLIFVFIFILCQMFQTAKAETTSSDLYDLINKITGTEHNCTACHGKQLEGNESILAPSIAGQNYQYIISRLKQIRQLPQGSEVLMLYTAKHLSDSQLIQISHLLSSLDSVPTPVNQYKFDKDLLLRGQQLVTEGDAKRGVINCTSCHGTDLAGVENVPNIAILSASYIKKRLKNITQSQPKPNEHLLNTMKTVAKSLSNKDVKSIIAYLTSLKVHNTTYSNKYTAKDLEWNKLEYKPVNISNELMWDKAADKYNKQQHYNKHHKFSKYTPPDITTLENTPEASLIRLGHYLFNNTQVLQGKYVGNFLKCNNCHLNSGLNPYTAPMYSAVGLPRYNDSVLRVGTLYDRISNCFIFGLNGKQPPVGSKPIVALISYIKWLSKDIKPDALIKERGVKMIPYTKPGNYKTGAFIYANKCAECHGDNGRGKFSSFSHNNETENININNVYPPLWGMYSFNWGSPLSDIDVMASFLKYTMPLGHTSLTDQDAWDVATFINSQERPQDPRFLISTTITRGYFHNTISAYGLFINNQRLGIGLSDEHKVEDIINLSDSLYNAVTDNTRSSTQQSNVTVANDGGEHNDTITISNVNYDGVSNKKDKENQKTKSKPAQIKHNKKSTSVAKSNHAIKKAKPEVAKIKAKDIHREPEPSYNNKTKLDDLENLDLSNIKSDEETETTTKKTKKSKPDIDPDADPDADPDEDPDEDPDADPDA